MMDELCKRSIKFTNGCVVRECAMVRRFARFALSVGRINSILGRNAIFFSIRYTGWILVMQNEGILMSVVCVLSMNHLSVWNFD